MHHDIPVLLFSIIFSPICGSAHHFQGLLEMLESKAGDDELGWIRALTKAAGAPKYTRIRNCYNVMFTMYHFHIIGFSCFCIDVFVYCIYIYIRFQLRSLADNIFLRPSSILSTTVTIDSTTFYPIRVRGFCCL